MRNPKFYLIPLLSMILAAGSGFAATRTPDSQTTAAIQARMYHSGVFKSGDVQVNYRDGVATLSGAVDNLASRLDAERAARKVAGVTRVVDNIVVRADDVSEGQILEQARHQVVMYYAYGIFDNVQLEAQGDKLIVSGQVTQPFKKTDIGNLLTRVRGVASVENRLEVLPTSAFDDQLRLQIARAIYGDPYFIHYANQALPPIHIIVKNGDVMLEGVVATPMDRTKAEMAARTAGLSFAVTDNLRVERA
jgi:osmotically-inducible protein OsmY